jgi:hypothetical protein
MHGYDPSISYQSYKAIKPTSLENRKKYLCDIHMPPNKR